MSKFKLNPREVRFDFSNSVYGEATEKELKKKVCEFCLPDKPVSIRVTSNGTRRFAFVIFKSAETAGAVLHYHLEKDIIPVAPAYLPQYGNGNGNAFAWEMEKVEEPKGDSHSNPAIDVTSKVQVVPEISSTFASEMVMYCKIPASVASTVESELALKYAIYSWEALSAAVELRLIDSTNIPVGILAMIIKKNKTEIK